ncbi:MAG: hypothetical protein AB7I79_15160 [Rhizobiaceae bacterium]
MKLITTRNELLDWILRTFLESGPQTMMSSDGIDILEGLTRDFKSYDLVGRTSDPNQPELQRSEGRELDLDADDQADELEGRAEGQMIEANGALNECIAAIFGPWLFCDMLIPIQHFLAVLFRYSYIDDRIVFEVSSGGVVVKSTNRLRISHGTRIRVAMAIDMWPQEPFAPEAHGEEESRTQRLN